MIITTTKVTPGTMLPIVPSPIVAPPPTPTPFVAMAQEGWSQEARASPLPIESAQFPAEMAPIPAPPAPTGKTFLVPWHLQDPPAELTQLVRWVLGSLAKPGEDQLRLLISGEYEGRESLEGFTSHLLTNEHFKDSEVKIRNAFPLLFGLAEETGLADAMSFRSRCGGERASAGPSATS